VLEIVEWRVKVEAIVLDLAGADFDVVLPGMEWFQEWDPQVDWKDLEFSIETNTGTKRIHSLLTTQRLQDFDIDKSRNPSRVQSYGVRRAGEIPQEGVEVEEK